MPVLKNARHEIFAQELAKGKPAYRAFEIAGYKNPASNHCANASRLSENERVLQRVTELREAAAKRNAITVDRVARELARIAFLDVRKAVQWGETVAVRSFDKDGSEVLTVQDTISLVNSDDLDEDTAAAISEVARTKEGVRIKFHDKRAALVDLGRYLNMFAEDNSSTVKLEIGERLRAALERRRAALLIEGEKADE